MSFYPRSIATHLCRHSAPNHQDLQTDSHACQLCNRVAERVYVKSLTEFCATYRFESTVPANLFAEHPDKISEGGNYGDI
jgi:hypothetical protein